MSLIEFRIGADTDFGMNRKKSDCFEMNFNPKLLSGKIIDENSDSIYSLSLIFLRYDTFET